MSALLKPVLEQIAKAKTPEDLRSAGEFARALDEDEKHIARWAYAYSMEEMRMMRLVANAGGK